MATSEIKKHRTHCCSKCRVPIREHNGRYGPKCDPSKQDLSKIPEESEDVAMIFDQTEDEFALQSIQTMMTAFQSQLLSVTQELSSLKVEQAKAKSMNPVSSPQMSGEDGSGGS